VTPEWIGDYEILRELGTGHFGTVFLARGEPPGRTQKKRLVAVKQLRDPANSDARATLVQEFELLAQVHHRSVCKVYEYLADEQAVVMEVVHGVTLRDVVDRCNEARAPVLTEAALEIASELADCLYQAWATPGRSGEPLQLVHRDLKPENVMLTPEGEVKILDFGLAAAHRGRVADRGAKGTVLYMAPEQARGEGVDHRTDLFAVGLILHELLTGAPVYDVEGTTDSSLDALLRRIEGAQVSDAVTRLEARIPGAGRVVARCLRPEPRQRYENGHELLLDLRRHLVRDRGAYLREFCDYFFGTLVRLDPLDPDAASARPSSRRGSEPRRGEPMSNDKKPPRPGAPPQRPAPAAGPPRPGGPPRPAAPAVPPGRPPTPPGGVSMRPTPAPAAPPSRPPAPAPSSPSIPPSKAGAKRPDATGMLPMVPIAGDEEAAAAAEGSGGKSATQFFAIPGAKKPAAPPAAPGTTSGPPSAAPPIAMSGNVPIASPGRGPGMGPGAFGGGGPVGIQGPIASGPVAQSMSPFQVGDAPEPPPGDAENRSRSMRIYVIIFALLAMVFSVAAVAVIALVFLLTQEPAEPTEDPPDDIAKVEPRTPPRTKAGGRDTAAPPPPMPVAPVPAYRPRPAPVPGAAPSSGPAPTPRPSSSSAGGNVGVTIPADARYPGGVEITCPNGFRARGAFSGQTATVPGVPSESCTLFFKGGSPAQFRPVSGGRNYRCTFPAPGTAACE
jgi:serine/threonine protein kinase